MCRKLIPGRDISEDVGVQHHVTLFALKVSRSLYFVTSISRGVCKLFPWAVGLDTSDVILFLFIKKTVPM